MYARELTFEAFADLLEESTITSRVDQGFMMTTTGWNTLLGHWTVVQALPGLTIVSQWEVDQPGTIMDGEELYISLNSVRNAGMQAGGFTFQL